MVEPVDSTPPMSDNDMVEDQYVVIELRVIKRQRVPAFGRIDRLLDQWGLYDRSQESVWVVAFDAARGLRRVAEVARGSYHSVDVPIPALMQAVHAFAADRFWLVHNHPSGVVVPSAADMDLTQTVMTAANNNGLRLEDHIIIGPPNKTFSFHEHGLIRWPEEALATAANEVVIANPTEVRHERK